MGEDRLNKHLALGIFYQDMGYNKDALQQLEYVLKEQPDNITALVYSALALTEEGELGKAERFLRRALAIDSKYPLLYSAFALIFFRRNCYDEAEFYAKHALKLAPNEKRALTLMGDICYQRKRLQYALMYFERAVSAYPEDASLRRRCASTLRALGRLQDAVYELRRAVEIEPSKVDTHIALGEVYEQLGEDAKAIEHYENAVLLASDNIKLLKRLARAHERAENLHIASQYYKKVLGMEPSDCGSLRALARIRMKQGLRGEALKLYLKVLDILPDDVEAHIGAAKIYAATGNIERETEHLRKAVASQPSSVAALFALARSSLRSGRHDEALKTTRKLLSVLPDDPRCWELAGDVSLKMGYEEEALFNYKRAILMGCRNPSVFYKVAELHTSPTLIRMLGSARARREKSRYIQEALRLDTDFSSVPDSLRDDVYRILSGERIMPFGRVVMRRRLLHRFLPLEVTLFERALLVRHGFRQLAKERVFPLKMLSPNFTYIRSDMTKKLLFSAVALLILIFSICRFGPLTLLSIGGYFLSAAAVADALSDRKGLLLISDSSTGKVLLKLPASNKAEEIVRRIGATIG